MDRELQQFGQIRHLIWDFDGTLFDTYPIMIGNLCSALREFGHEAEPVEVQRLMLQSFGAARDHYADVFGLDRDALMAAYLRHDALASQQLAAVPMDGAREVLQRAVQTGRHNYIFTHRHVQQTWSYLQKHALAQCICDLVGPETPGFARKPAPDGIVLLMARHAIEPQTAVMVGDRQMDLASGRNAGIATAHLICPTVPEKLACTWRLQSLRALLPMMEI